MLVINLAHYLDVIKSTPLFQIFLDLYKSYIVLDRGGVLKILWSYGVGTRMMGILELYWENQIIVPKLGGWLRE